MTKRVVKSRQASVKPGGVDEAMKGHVETPPQLEPPVEELPEIKPSERRGGWRRRFSSKEKPPLLNPEVQKILDEYGTIQRIAWSSEAQERLKPLGYKVEVIIPGKSYQLKRLK